MEDKRSDGVLVLGIVAVVYGIWSLLHDFSSLWITLNDPQLYSQMLQARGPKAAQLRYFESIYLLITYSIFIVSGAAVLRMKNWGRILLVTISSISFVLGLLLPYIWTRIMSDEYHKVFFVPTPIPILYVMNIWFFNRKRIREQFAKE